MLKKIKTICVISLLSVSFLVISQLQAAQGKSCISSSALKGNSRSTYLSKTTRGKTSNSKTTSKRNYKLQKRHINQRKLLNEIHKQQIYFLNKYSGKATEHFQEERQVLLNLINELPDDLKESDKYFFNKLANIEIVVHDVINKKIKYQSKKNFKTPKDLLEDIQKKQRQYLLLYQKKESKKYSKK